MAAVWTAKSLQRRDGTPNSLARSLGCLLSKCTDEDQYLRNSDLATDVRHISNTEGYTSNQILPTFEKISTNTSSSVTFLGKRITRSYQSAFRLPDRQFVLVTRKEEFVPEESTMDVTVTLALASDPEGTLLNGDEQYKERIADYLDDSGWACDILASSESRDSELMGRLGRKYFNSAYRQSRLERHESQRARKEVVYVRKVSPSSDSDDDAGAEAERTNAHMETQLLSDEALPASEQKVSIRRPPSRVFEPYSPTAPILGRTDPPGTRIRAPSTDESKKRFTELLRTWDSRSVEYQASLSQRRDDHGPNSDSSYPYHGHRGATVTSILPGREKIDPLVDRQVAHSPSPYRTLSGTRDPTHRGQSLNLPRSYSRDSDLLSPSSVFSEPAIDREEKDTQFVYNKENIRVGQESIGRLYSDSDGKFALLLPCVY